MLGTMVYHISSLEAVDFLDKFLSMNLDTSGCVKLHDFLDVEKNGSITFKKMAHCTVLCSSWQFLFGVAHVMKKPLLMQACELAFAECDVTNGMQAPWLVEIGIYKA
ncbi:hypothetical protein GOBAR_DD21614 [Gossypium barbadense]|nr:hypothetical protein GOBAR_DD21614 [Gossypium barbadense]